MNDPTRDLLARLERAGCDPRAAGPDSWESRCPAHRGSRHNLSIKQGADGRCLLHCHHVDESGCGCSPEAILQQLGITVFDLFPESGGQSMAETMKNSPMASKPRSRKAHLTFEAAVNAVLWGLRQSKGRVADPSWHYQSHWTYLEPDGSPSFVVVRFQSGVVDAGGKAGKEYRPIHKTEAGFTIGDPPGPLPLYHLPDLGGCGRVFVTEGEKCADLLRALGLTATSPAHGAKSPKKSDWAPLAGAEVVILPDADSPGEGFAKLVVGLLGGLDPAPTVRIVRLPGLTEGEDVEQWLAARGRDPAPDAPWMAEARAELERLVDSSLPLERPGSDDCKQADRGRSRGIGRDDGPRLAPGTLVKALDRDNIGRVVQDDGKKVMVHFVSPSGYEATVPFDRSDLECPGEVEAPLEWRDEPRPLRSQLMPVPPMPEAMIPVPFRRWLADIAERVSCNLEFPVVGAISAAAAVVGRKLAIRPKRQDDWAVVPNLWGAIVGRPGVFKTPALQESMRPLNRLVQEANDSHAAASETFQADLLIARLQAESAVSELKKAVKDKVSQDKLDELARQATRVEALTEPACRRYMANDPTVEKLGELLRDNPSGVMIFRDELTGWLRSLDKPGRESDRSFYLEAWNGGGSSFTYDRIGRGTVVIPSPCVSLLGGIQPGPLRSYLKAILSGQEADDGLISRFQLLVYPDTPARWHNVDRWPDCEAKDRAFAIFRALDGLDATSVGAQFEGNDPLPYLRFTDEAQAFFDEWRSRLENEKLRQEGESPLIESHLSKYRSLMPSLALLFHLIEIVDGQLGGPVSLDAAQLAAAWCDFLEAHARRIYASVGEAEVDAARTLADRLKDGKIPNPFSPRDVYRRGLSNLTNSEEVARAVAVLEEHGWVMSVETRQTGGAPRTDIHVHPSVVAQRRAG